MVREKSDCFKGGCCQCNLVGSHNLADFRLIDCNIWRHPGTLYNSMKDVKFAFGGDFVTHPDEWGCECDYSYVNCNYPREIDTTNGTTEHICVELVRTKLYVLGHILESKDDRLECMISLEYDLRKDQFPRCGAASKVGRFRGKGEARRKK